MSEIIAILFAFFITLIVFLIYNRRSKKLAEAVVVDDGKRRGRR